MTREGELLLRIKKKITTIIGMNPWGGELLLRTKEKKVTIIAIVRDEQEKKILLRIKKKRI